MKKTLIVSLILLTLFLSPNDGHAQEDGPSYIVQSGDTLSGIATTFGTSVNQLMEANGLTNPNDLQPGQELTLPGFSGVQGVLTTQQVQFGETLDFLSRRLRADTDSLAKINRVLHPNRLYLGQSLILPEAEAAVLETSSSVRPYLVPEGQGLLQYAAGVNRNPWEISFISSAEPRLWWVPGEWASVPTAETEPAALPAPIEAVAVSPAQSEQGETAVVEVQSSAPLQLEGRLADWNLNFVKVGEGSQLALQGVNALIEPGLYELSLEWSGEGGDRATGFSQPYPIRSGDYGFDPILFVPEETVGPENTVPEDELVAELVAPVTPEKRWEGAFEWPSDHFVESFPSVFGTRRNYNNTGYNAYHTGLDFYGGIGVEILAPAPGEVVFSDDLVVRGKTTVLDHGWGVYSIYMHQSETMVAPGDEVDTGQVIGLVGASGRVTGAHLHWEIRVGGVPVQPLDWVQQAYP